MAMRRRVGRDMGGSGGRRSVCSDRSAMSTGQNRRVTVAPELRHAERYALPWAWTARGPSRRERPRRPDRAGTGSAAAPGVLPAADVPHQDQRSSRARCRRARGPRSGPGGCPRGRPAGRDGMRRRRPHLPVSPCQPHSSGRSCSTGCASARTTPSSRPGWLTRCVSLTRSPRWRSSTAFAALLVHFVSRSQASQTRAFWQARGREQPREDGSRERPRRAMPSRGG